MLEICIGSGIWIQIKTGDSQSDVLARKRLLSTIIKEASRTHCKNVTKKYNMYSEWDTQTKLFYVIIIHVLRSQVGGGGGKQTCLSPHKITYHCQWSD